MSAARAARTQPGLTQPLTNPSASSQVRGPSNSATQPEATYTPYPNLTREQLDARFNLEQRKIEIELQKAKADLAVGQARTARENEESHARIAVIQARPITAAAVAPHPRVEEEEPIGEITPAALLVASRYPGLPKAKIARIFANKFRPESLYKLRRLK